jgi:hypothetical protein
MSTTTDVGLSTEKLDEIADLARSAGEQAVQLRVVERFLSEVERRLLKTTPQVFDIERIRTALQILKTFSEQDEIDEVLEAEFRLDQEFHLWRELIIERDQRIETYHFRRLCDSAPYPLEDEIFVVLAKFYRELHITSATQSKFDLCITRLFTRPVSSARRELRGLRSDNIKRLENLLPGNDDQAPSSGVNDAVAAIDCFINEALDFRVFEDLVKANIFDRYREFKRDLDYLFFQPEILAAAVECNVVLGNVFDELLRTADEQLSSRLTVDMDLASALHDPAPETRSHINDLFRVFFGDNGETHAEALEGDVDYLGKMLSFASSHTAASSANADVPDSTPAQARLAPFLRTLTEAKPNVELLLKQFGRSEILKTFDINDFLFCADGNPDVLSRRALGIILWSLEFRETELKHSKELTESIQREATSLLYKAEHLATTLQHEIEVSDELNESRLRGVLNVLMDSRIKLERGIVRFTNRKIAGNGHSADASYKASTTPVKGSTFADTLSRWLIIVLAMLAVATGVMFFIQRQSGELLGSGTNLSEIDPRTLPQNEFMMSAYRHERTLFITARDSWSQRSLDDRRETIKEIFERPGFKFQTIVVMSQNGAILENMSRDGNYLDQEKKISAGDQGSN